MTKAEEFKSLNQRKGRQSKSTRATANRSKPDAPMNLTAEHKKSAPRSVARTAQAKRERVRGKPA